MKKFITALCLFSSFAAFAGSYRGYLMEGVKGQFYAGLVEGQPHVDVQLSLKDFNTSQIKVMQMCMDRGEPYAIDVEALETQRRIPSEISGRSTSFHDLEVVSVKCVKAPGFHKIWISENSRF